MGGNQSKITPAHVFHPYTKMRDIAVITGAGGGIGQAISEELASKLHVVLIDIVEERLNAVAELVGKDNSTVFICDITDSDAIKAVSEEVKKIGQVRVLVNNAGQAWVESLHELTPETWRKEISLNLDAAFYCFKAFESSLKTTPGANVINIASVNGLMYVGNPAYSAAKAGLLQFTSAIAVEYAQYGIRANSIAPGTVRTYAWERRLEKNPSAMDGVLQFYPLKQPILPSHIAKAVAFLSSEDASTITGICLPVDAGLTTGSAVIARAVTNSEHF